MRIAAVAVFIACLTACKSGNQNSDAVRQGVIDYLAKVGMNVKGMDITLSNVKYNGNQADVSVAFAVKGSGQVAMTKGYHLELQGNQWTVMGSQGGGDHGKGGMPGADNPHGGAPTPGGAENPHGGGAVPAAQGGGKMPSPEDLPPAGTRK